MATTTDRVHGVAWSWREPRDGDFFRTCSYCGSISPGDLAAEAAGGGTCRTCGQEGWEACFRGQQPAWLAYARESGELERLRAEDPEGVAGIEAAPAAHSYNPGGWYASWADRKYGWPHKFYVEQLQSREPGRLHIVSAHRDTKTGPYAPGGEKYQPVQERMPGLRWVPVSEIPEGTVTAGWRDLADHYDLVGLSTRPVLHAKFYSIHLADPAVSDEVKEKISTVSGLRFTFYDDGKVRWCDASQPPHEHED